MPEAGPSLILPLLVLSAVLVAGAAGVDRALGKRDAETLFWTGFTAFLGVLLTAAWGITAGPGAAAAVGVVMVTGSLAASVWVAARRRGRIRRTRQERFRASLDGTARRHREVLSRWTAYELDPWLAAEHSGLHDVRQPETKEFIRALKAAETLRPEDGLRPESGAEADVAAYAEAVDRLERSLTRAEKAARDGRAA